jgi:hypothetical protein
MLANRNPESNVTPPRYASDENTILHPAITAPLCFIGLASGSGLKLSNSLEWCEFQYFKPDPPRIEL